MGLDPHCKLQNGEWTQDRRFEPSSRYSDDVDLGYIEICDYDENWTYVACDDDRPCTDCNCLAPHLDCIVIAVDGACKGNGTPNARAAVGVFVSKTSKYNKSVLLAEPNTTNQVAELRAGILALDQAMEIRAKGLGEKQLRMVVIKADSEYLVKGMTEWVFKWETNGYRTSKGRPVTNLGLFRQLHALVRKINASDVEVLFWHVPRDQNKQADELASRALRV